MISPQLSFSKSHHPFNQRYTILTKTTNKKPTNDYRCTESPSAHTSADTQKHTWAQERQRERRAAVIGTASRADVQLGKTDAGGSTLVPVSDLHGLPPLLVSH